MTTTDIQSLVLGVLQGLGFSTVFLLAVFIGFCVLVGFTKTKRITKVSPVVRSLDDRLGSGARFLTPDAPRGPADQLKTPELLEQSGRQV
ncbi:MAG: hypothetical protein VYE68_16800 [Acidobacteriota bacterium]|nr:hypothetical protein [Acidobacteriota bacterium]